MKYAETLRPEEQGRSCHIRDDVLPFVLIGRGDERPKLVERKGKRIINPA